MSKKILKFFLLVPLLMAFKCYNDDDLPGTYVYNNYKVSVTPQSTFSINDTIWINGKVSSMVFDLAINDSIFTDSPQADEISVLKFVQPTQAYNCKDAIDKFELIIEIGSLSFLPACENGQMGAYPQLSADSSYYSYKIGLKALNIGDYVIFGNNSSLTNQNRNEYILDDYPMEFRPNQLGINKCGRTSYGLPNETEGNYFLSVE